MFLPFLLPEIPPTVTMPATAEAVAFFRQRPVLDRILRATAAKYSGRGDLSGNVQLEEEEVRAVRSLRCKVSRRGTVRVDELDRALRASRFACSLVELLTGYFDRPITTRRDDRLAQQRAWDEFLAELSDSPGSSRRMGSRWLRRDTKYIRNAWLRDVAGARDAAKAVLRALEMLDGSSEVIYLPVLAQWAGVDPHAFDSGTPGGRMLEHALWRLNPVAGIDYPLDAEGREGLFSRVGLATDEVSSTVLAAGLMGDDPLLHALRIEGSPIAIPLRTLSVCGTARGWKGMAFAVENPAVFAGLWQWAEQHAPDDRPTLVCTQGFFSLAARRLLNTLIGNGTRVLYSGDFDLRGLMIARDLIRRVPDRTKLWRMDLADYMAAVKKPAPDHKRTPQNVRSIAVDFPLLAAAIREHGPAYQEAMIPALCGDLAELY